MISRSCSSTIWKLSTNHSAAGVIVFSSRIVRAIARYDATKTRPLSRTRGVSNRPTRASSVTTCAVARLAACCSSRSTPKSSARIGSSSSTLLATDENIVPMGFLTYSGVVRLNQLQKPISISNRKSSSVVTRRVPPIRHPNPPTPLQMVVVNFAIRTSGRYIVRPPHEATQRQAPAPITTFQPLTAPSDPLELEESEP